MTHGIGNQEFWISKQGFEKVYKEADFEGKRADFSPPTDNFHSPHFLDSLTSKRVSRVDLLVSCTHYSSEYSLELCLVISLAK